MSWVSIWVFLAACQPPHWGLSDQVEVRAHADRETPLTLAFQVTLPEALRDGEVIQTGWTILTDRPASDVVVSISMDTADTRTQRLGGSTWDSHAYLYTDIEIWGGAWPCGDAPGDCRLNVVITADVEGAEPVQLDGTLVVTVHGPGDDEPNAEVRLAAITL
jgi:hypothetical protein